MSCLVIKVSWSSFRSSLFQISVQNELYIADKYYTPYDGDF